MAMDNATTSIDLGTTAVALVNNPELRKMAVAQSEKTKEEEEEEEGEEGEEEGLEDDIDLIVSSKSLMPHLSYLEAEPSEELLAEMEVNPLVDADGCVETLYYYLWKKDANGRR